VSDSEVTRPDTNADVEFVEVGVSRTIQTVPFEGLTWTYRYGRPVREGENPKEAMISIRDNIYDIIVESETEARADLGTGKTNLGD